MNAQGNTQMPCDMYGHDTGSLAHSEALEARRLAREAMDAANKVTDILCRVLRSMPVEQISALDQETRNWFAEHLRHDAEQGRP